MNLRSRLALLLTLALGFAAVPAFSPAPSDVASAATIALAAPKKAAATVTIGKIKNRTVATGKKSAVKPIVTKKGKVKITAKRLTVKKGSKTVAKNVKTAKLPAGTYKVTTKVKYRVKAGTTWSKTKTKTRTQNLKITKKASPKPPAKPSAPAKPTSSGECPASAPIKGNRGNSEWIYHVPGGAYYSRTNAEECFPTEAAAKKAGYRRSLR